MSDYKQQAKEHAARRVERVHKACGGEAEMQRVADAAVKKGVHEHERHDHRGEKETHLKLGGESSKRRLDRAPRKSGGRTKGKGTEVNIIIDAGQPEGAHAPPMAGALPPRPMPSAAAALPPPMAPRPPMMGAPPGAMPPALPGRSGLPLPVRKRGGKVMRMDAGAGSGIGRLEKAADYGART